MQEFEDLDIIIQGIGKFDLPLHRVDKRFSFLNIHVFDYVLIIAGRRLPLRCVILNPPPVPGTQDIVPLTTSGQLKVEGLEQRNCVGSYGRKVREGSVYIYKVLRPERATLAITPGPDGFWRRSEIERSGNRSVAPSTKAAVDRWLSLYSLSI